MSSSLPCADGANTPYVRWCKSLSLVVSETILVFVSSLTLASSIITVVLLFSDVSAYTSITGGNSAL